MAWRMLGQPVACKKRGIRGATPRIAAVGPGSDATVAVQGAGVRARQLMPAGSRCMGQPELLKVNDERAASQARPTYPGGRGNLPESRMSPRPYSEITGRQGCRPFDARSCRSGAWHARGAAQRPLGRPDERAGRVRGVGRRHKLPHEHHRQAPGPGPTACCPEEWR